MRKCRIARFHLSLINPKKPTMKIASWNVNGIRSAMKKGFSDWLQKENADIVCLQETKAMRDNIPADIGHLQGYHAYWHAGTRPGYAGTLTLSREDPLSWNNKFEVPEFSEHGRVVETEFPGFTLLNIYFPNGGTRADGTEMLSYKLKFYDDLIKYANTLRGSGKSIILTGDFNIAHTERDIARPKENEDSIGFLPVERAKLGELMENGYIDAWRHFHPNDVEYTLTPDLMGKVKRVYHENSVMGSDHCPIVLEISL